MKLNRPPSVFQAISAVFPQCSGEITAHNSVSRQPSTCPDSKVKEGGCHCVGTGIRVPVDAPRSAMCPLGRLPEASCDWLLGHGSVNRLSVSKTPWAQAGRSEMAKQPGKKG